MDDISWVNAASISKVGGTAWDDDAAAGGGTGGGWGTPPWALCHNCALDFMRVWMPRGFGIRDLGSESEISVTT
jgi:hypothetical protein